MIYFFLNVCVAYTGLEFMAQLRLTLNFCVFCLPFPSAEILGVQNIVIYSAGFRTTYVVSLSVRPSLRAEDPSCLTLTACQFGALACCTEQIKDGDVWVRSQNQNLNVNSSSSTPELTLHCFYTADTGPRRNSNES